jgi:hypothetical protein
VLLFQKNFPQISSLSHFIQRESAPASGCYFFLGNNYTVSQFCCCRGKRKRKSGAIGACSRKMPRESRGTSERAAVSRRVAAGRAGPTGTWPSRVCTGATPSTVLRVYCSRCSAISLSPRPKQTIRDPKRRRDSSRHPVQLATCTPLCTSLPTSPCNPKCLSCRPGNALNLAPVVHGSIA